MLAALLDRAPDACAEKKVGHLWRRRDACRCIFAEATFPGSVVAVDAGLTAPLLKPPAAISSNSTLEFRSGRASSACCIRPLLARRWVSPSPPHKHLDLKYFCTRTPSLHPDLPLSLPLWTRRDTPSSQPTVCSPTPRTSPILSSSLQRRTFPS